MSGKVRFDNPADVHPPLGPYSHVAIVPAGADLVFLAGQIGIRPDGTVGTTIGEQAEQAFANVVSLLRTQGLEVGAVVKLTVFIAAGQAGEPVREARIRHFGAHQPTSTTLYVSQLVRPDWLVEVEAIAARG